MAIRTPEISSTRAAAANSGGFDPGCLIQASETTRRRLRYLRGSDHTKLCDLDTALAPALAWWGWFGDACSDSWSGAAGPRLVLARYVCSRELDRLGLVVVGGSLLLSLGGPSLLAADQALGLRDQLVTWWQLRGIEPSPASQWLEADLQDAIEDLPTPTRSPMLRSRAQRLWWLLPVLLLVWLLGPFWMAPWLALDVRGR